jgi:CheY-like chemotaxis protein
MPESKSRRKKSPKRILALPDLEHAKTAVLNSLTSVPGGRTGERGSGPENGPSVHRRHPTTVSLYRLRLPIAVGAPQIGHEGALEERWTAAATASPTLPSPRLDDLRVLVVDDTDDGRALTSLVLTQAGASVTAVRSVREALEVLERDRPDAMVSDIGMPDQDGYALIRQIRQHEGAHGGFLPAVALTGYARAADRARILAAGFQAHVTKPLDPVVLAAAIATMTHPLRDDET